MSSPDRDFSRRALFLSVAAAAGFGQPREKAELEVWFRCPMDPDIRAKGPAKCSKCGMALVPAIAEPVAYLLDLAVQPRTVPAGRPVVLTFRVVNPKTKKPVTQFEVVHERLFHQFVVDQTLRFFAHEHPEARADGSFDLRITLPKPGIYRLVSDFYPVGGTPQLLTKTLITAGYSEPFQPAALKPDASTKQGENVRVELRMEPDVPLAGKLTRLFFRVTPADGLEPYLGAWAHLMAISSDLIDAVHAHPEIADGGENMQFNLIFPRAGAYRIWLQVQRAGVVNTTVFTAVAERL